MTFLIPLPLVDKHGFLADPLKTMWISQISPSNSNFFQIFSKFYSKNSSCNCSNSDTKRAFEFMRAKWVAVIHICPRGQAPNPSLPHVDKHGFFGNPPPPALSTWFMVAPLGAFCLQAQRF